MRMRTEKKDYKEKFLRRMLTHVGEYRKRYFFEKWANCVRCQQISEDVNVSVYLCGVEVTIWCAD